jgi:hypothetical protein
MFDMGVRKERQVLSDEEAGVLPEENRKNILRLAENISCIPQDAQGEEGANRNFLCTKILKMDRRKPAQTGANRRKPAFFSTPGKIDFHNCTFVYYYNNQQVPVNRGKTTYISYLPRIMS